MIGTSLLFSGSIGGLISPFDTIAPTAGYSLRALTLSYTGAVVRVRRESDDVEQDFTASQITDGTLGSFCTGTNGFVHTWYDQFGSNDAVQSTAASQPKIWDSVTGLVTEGGRPALDFASDFLEVSSSTGSFNYLHDGTTSAVFGVVTFGKVANPDSVYTFMGNNAGTTTKVGALISYDDRSIVPRNDASRVIITKGVFVNYVSLDIINDKITPAEQKLMSYFIDTGNATASLRTQTGIDGGVLFGNNTDTNAPVTSDATHNLQIGARGDDAIPLTGYLQELIFYNSDQSANRTAIEDNINNYYDIY